MPICLITGATDGVGKMTALELANRGFSLVLAARNEEKAQRLAKEITAATGNAQLTYLIADLRSFAQVRQLADTFRQRYSKLDVLINNAGIFSPQRSLTEDGFETTFQVNYLSQFLLTQLLLEHLKKGEQGRVINLSSSVYTLGKFDVKNLQSETHYSVMGAYATSKLLVLLFTLELKERLRGTRITANAVHPGVVRTPMMFNAPGLFKVMSYLALPFSVSPRKGAETSVYLASSRDVGGVSGKYYTGSKITKVKTKFDTEENRSLLWNISVECLRGKPYAPDGLVN